MNDVTILTGDVLDMLKTLPDESVQTVVTSPPYWGLRDYGTATWEGGDADCLHRKSELRRGVNLADSAVSTRGGAKKIAEAGWITYSDVCGQCGAIRIDRQIGLERTPQEYVDKMVSVFREVRRVLRDDGTLWLNLGDSYVGSATTGEKRPGAGRADGIVDDRAQRNRNGIGIVPGLKPKDLVGIPWRVAFALQADGWVLRSEIIWQKPNPMPESVTDRPTKAHEQIFLFCKARWTGNYPPHTMRESDARWMALLLETEGNIAIRRYTVKRLVPQHALQVAIANSDRTILEAAQRIAGCGAILEAKGTNRPVFYLQWTTKEASALLWEMYPYLFGKQRQAAIGLMLEERRSNTNKGLRDDIFRKEGRHFFLREEELALREKMWMAVKCLNKHQPVDLSWLREPDEGQWIPERYFYDVEAIKEPGSYQGEYKTPDGWDTTTGQGGHGSFHKNGREKGFKKSDKQRGHSRRHDGLNRWDQMEKAQQCSGTRNKRSVWTIATQPYPEAHFATFPQKLIEPCILAGSRPGDVVLDPFGGAATTGVVARRLGRRAILIELNPKYVELAQRRLSGVSMGLPLDFTSTDLSQEDDYAIDGETAH